MDCSKLCIPGHSALHITLIHFLKFSLERQWKMATDAKSGASAGDLTAVSADIYMGEEICIFSNTSNPTFRSLHISDGAHGQPFGCFECYQSYGVFLKVQRWPYHFCEILSNSQKACADHRPDRGYCRRVFDLSLGSSWQGVRSHKVLFGGFYCSRSWETEGIVNSEEGNKWEWVNI